MAISKIPVFFVEDRYQSTITNPYMSILDNLEIGLPQGSVVGSFGYRHCISPFEDSNPLYSSLDPNSTNSQLLSKANIKTLSIWLDKLNEQAHRKKKWINKPWLKWKRPPFKETIHHSEEYDLVRLQWTSTCILIRCSLCDSKPMFLNLVIFSGAYLVNSTVSGYGVSKDASHLTRITKTGLLPQNLLRSP